MATVRSLPTGPPTATSRALARAASDRRRCQEARRASARARWPPCPGGLVKPDPSLFAFLLGKLAASRTGGDPHDRGRRPGAGEARARAARPLAETLALAGPVEVDRLLAAFEQSTDEALGLKLVDVLSGSPALSSLRVDALKAHLAKYGPAVQNEAEERSTRQAQRRRGQAEGPARAAVAHLAAGDIRRGQLVFHSEKAACYSCHAIGYRGGNVGPDLTRIGSVRADRDLLEAIVFPSASLVRSFEPIAVATRDGKVYNGLLRGETADELRLATGVNQEARIARREIEEMRPSTVSIMPAGLDQQLTPQELADLVAFLKACK